jgi:hypothetical protein
MKQLRTAVFMAVAMVLGACNGRHESVTGSYGQSLLSGQLIVDGQTSSAEGVEVSVSGTGMTMRVAADGNFAFAGAPDDVVLAFRRASDGIDSSLRVDAAAGPLVIELTGTTAKTSSRRRSAGRGAGEAFQFEGLIVSATAESIVVFTSKKEEVTIKLAPETVIRKGNTTLAVADLVVDARVHVKARQTGDAYTAIEVKLQEGTDDDGGVALPPVPVRQYEGTVRSSSATELVVFTSHREEVTFVLTATTDIRKGNTPVLPADIQVGWTVHVKATESAADGTKTATRVIVQNTLGEEVKLSGTVKSVAAGSLVVTTATGDVTVQTSSSTQIRKAGKKIALSDVAVGNTVEVEGRRVNATTVDAKKITVE